MNWIETTFGVSPDGGSGMTEATIIFSLGMVVLVVIGATPRLRERLRQLFWDWPTAKVSWFAGSIHVD
jgi:hypothetical protein